MKKIHYHDLDAITLIYDQVWQIDKDIEQIMNFSGQMIGNDYSLETTFELFNVRQEMEKEAQRYQQYESFMQMVSHPVPNVPIFLQGEQPSTNPVFSLVFTDSQCLKILKVLVDIKTREKTELFRKLKKMGVKIKTKP